VCARARARAGAHGTHAARRRGRAQEDADTRRRGQLLVKQILHACGARARVYHARTRACITHARTRARGPTHTRIRTHVRGPTHARTRARANRMHEHARTHTRRHARRHARTHSRTQVHRARPGLFLRCGRVPHPPGREGASARRHTYNARTHTRSHTNACTHTHTHTHCTHMLARTLIRTSARMRTQAGGEVCAGLLQTVRAKLTGGGAQRVATRRGSVPCEYAVIAP
jgi:hypothetical protein